MWGLGGVLHSLSVDANLVIKQTLEVLTFQSFKVCIVLSSIKPIRLCCW